ncbi:hypothetical protein ACIPPJ_23800 [Streptomyces sp. NPDC086091]|uniref:hypothetical protein n=1 Tax=Streptomyces sp. NPDC086091 TaxID=3365751 RepID=UPI003803733C
MSWTPAARNHSPAATAVIFTRAVRVPSVRVRPGGAHTGRACHWSSTDVASSTGRDQPERRVPQVRTRHQ